MGRTPWWSLGLALLVVLGTYHGSLDNPFVGWDDGVYVLRNRLVTAPEQMEPLQRLLTPALGYPVPLPVLVHGWAWSWSSQPWLFHAINLVAHATNVLLLFVILDREIERPRVTLVAALAFAAHPIVVEPVAWVTGLKDLLVGTGVLLALWGWKRRAIWGWLPGTFVALASKPTAVLLGPAFAVIARTAGRRALAVSAVATAVGVAVTAWSLTHEPPDLYTREPTTWTIGRPLRALGLQVEHVFAPYDLSHLYPLEATGPEHAVIGALATALIVVLAARWYRRTDPRLPWLLVGIATYLPASNLVPLHRFTADSYMYVPWLSACAVLAHTWREQAPFFSRARPLVRRAAMALPGILIPLWALLSRARVEDWSSNEALWASAVTNQPGHGELVFDYGQVLAALGRFEDERTLYLTNLEALAHHERVPGALPLFFERAGRLDAADQWYAHAFDSPTPQVDMLYWQYAEYVARHPDRFEPAHAPALRHSLAVYLQGQNHGTLDAQQRQALADLARQVGRPRWAEVLSEAARP